MKHYANHVRDKKSLICSNCGVQFNSTVELLIHRKRHETDNNNNGKSKAAAVSALALSRRRRNSFSSLIAEDTPPEILKAKSQVYRCLHCSKPFYIFTQLVAHQETHKDQGYQCPVCLKFFFTLGDLILHGNDHQDAEDGQFCDKILV